MFCKLVDNEVKGKLDLTEGLSTTKEESFEIKEDPEHLEAMSALQLSIRQVREGPPCLPSICFYTFINAYQGLVSSFFQPQLPCKMQIHIHVCNESVKYLKVFSYTHIYM